MEKRIYPEPIESVVSPEPFQRQSFTDAAEAVAALKVLYNRNTQFLRDSFVALAQGADPNKRYRAFYPEIGVTTSSFSQIELAPGLWPHADAGDFLDHDHAARSVRELPASSSCG